MPISRKIRSSRVRGFFDPLSFIGIVFLVISLIVGVVSVSKKGFSFDIGKKAAVVTTTTTTQCPEICNPINEPCPSGQECYVKANGCYDCRVIPTHPPSTPTSPPATTCSGAFSGSCVDLNKYTCTTTHGQLDCGAGLTCGSSCTIKPACTSPNFCAPNTGYCSVGQVTGTCTTAGYVCCKASAQTPTPKPTPVPTGTCNAQMIEDLGCNTNNCSGKRAQKWRTVNCSTNIICVSDSSCTSVPECTASQKRCVNSNKDSQSCGSNGKWGISASCGTTGCNLSTGICNPVKVAPKPTVKPTLTPTVKPLTPIGSQPSTCAKKNEDCSSEPCCDTVNIECRNVFGSKICAAKTQPTSTPVTVATKTSGSQTAGTVISNFLSNTTSNLTCNGQCLWKYLTDSDLRNQCYQQCKNNTGTTPESIGFGDSSLVISQCEKCVESSMGDCSSVCGGKGAIAKSCENNNCNGKQCDTKSGENCRNVPNGNCSCFKSVNTTAETKVESPVSNPSTTTTSPVTTTTLPKWKTNLTGGNKCYVGEKAYDSGTYVIGAYNHIYGCDGLTGAWTDETKLGMLPQDMVANSNPKNIPIWFTKDSLTWQSAELSATDFVRRTDPVTGVISPPDKAKQPCLGRNEEKYYPDTTVALGPDHVNAPKGGTDNRWICTDGLWKPCDLCILTPKYMPVYMKEDPRAAEINEKIGGIYSEYQLNLSKCDAETDSKKKEDCLKVAQDTLSKHDEITKNDQDLIVKQVDNSNYIATNIYPEIKKYLDNNCADPKKAVSETCIAIKDYINALGMTYGLTPEQVKGYEDNFGDSIYQDFSYNYFSLNKSVKYCFSKPDCDFSDSPGSVCQNKQDCDTKLSQLITSPVYLYFEAKNNNTTCGDLTVKSSSNVNSPKTICDLYATTINNIDSNPEIANIFTNTTATKSVSSLYTEYQTTSDIYSNDSKLIAEVCPFNNGGINTQSTYIPLSASAASENLLCRGGNPDPDELRYQLLNTIHVDLPDWVKSQIKMDYKWSVLGEYQTSISSGKLEDVFALCEKWYSKEACGSIPDSSNNKIDTSKAINLITQKLNKIFPNPTDEEKNLLGSPSIDLANIVSLAYLIDPTLCQADSTKYNCAFFQNNKDILISSIPKTMLSSYYSNVITSPIDQVVMDICNNQSTYYTGYTNQITGVSGLISGLSRQSSNLNLLPPSNNACSTGDKAFYTLLNRLIPAEQMVPVIQQREMNKKIDLAINGLPTELISKCLNDGNYKSTHSNADACTWQNYLEYLKGQIPSEYAQAVDANPDQRILNSNYKKAVGDYMKETNLIIGQTNPEEEFKKVNEDAYNEIVKIVSTQENPEIIMALINTWNSRGEHFYVDILKEIKNQWTKPGINCKNTDAFITPQKLFKPVTWLGDANCNNSTIRVFDQIPLLGANVKPVDVSDLGYKYSAYANEITLLQTPSQRQNNLDSISKNPNYIEWKKQNPDATASDYQQYLAYQYVNNKDFLTQNGLLDSFTVSLYTKLILSGDPIGNSDAIKATLDSYLKQYGFNSAEYGQKLGEYKAKIIIQGNGSEWLKNQADEAYKDIQFKTDYEKWVSDQKTKQPSRLSSNLSVEEFYQQKFISAYQSFTVMTNYASVKSLIKDKIAQNIIGNVIGQNNSAFLNGIILGRINPQEILSTIEDQIKIVDYMKENKIPNTELYLEKNIAKILLKAFTDSIDSEEILNSFVTNYNSNPDNIAALNNLNQIREATKNLTPLQQTFVENLARDYGSIQLPGGLRGSILEGFLIKVDSDPNKDMIYSAIADRLVQQSIVNNKTSFGMVTAFNVYGVDPSKANYQTQVMPVITGILDLSGVYQTVTSYFGEAGLALAKGFPAVANGMMTMTYGQGLKNEAAKIKASAGTNTELLAAANKMNAEANWDIVRGYGAAFSDLFGKGTAILLPTTQLASGLSLGLSLGQLALRIVPEGLSIWASGSSLSNTFITCGKNGYGQINGWDCGMSALQTGVSIAGAVTSGLNVANYLNYGPDIVAANALQKAALADSTAQEASNKLLEAARGLKDMAAKNMSASIQALNTANKIIGIIGIPTYTYQAIKSCGNNDTLNCALSVSMVIVSIMRITTPATAEPKLNPAQRADLLNDGARALVSCGMVIAGKGRGEDCARDIAGLFVSGGYALDQSGKIPNSKLTVDDQVDITAKNIEEYNTRLTEGATEVTFEGLDGQEETMSMSNAKKYINNQITTVVTMKSQQLALMDMALKEQDSETLGPWGKLWQNTIKAYNTTLDNAGEGAEADPAVISLRNQALALYQMHQEEQSLLVDDRSIFKKIGDLLLNDAVKAFNEAKTAYEELDSTKIIEAINQKMSDEGLSYDQAINKLYGEGGESIVKDWLDSQTSLVTAHNMLINGNNNNPVQNVAETSSQEQKAKQQAFSVAKKYISVSGTKDNAIYEDYQDGKYIIKLDESKVANEEDLPVLQKYVEDFQKYNDTIIITYDATLRSAGKWDAITTVKLANGDVLEWSPETETQEDFYYRVAKERLNDPTLFDGAILENDGKVITNGFFLPYTNADNSITGLPQAELIADSIVTPGAKIIQAPTGIGKTLVMIEETAYLKMMLNGSEKVTIIFKNPTDMNDFVNVFTERAAEELGFNMYKVESISPDLNDYDQIKSANLFVTTSDIIFNSFDKTGMGGFLYDAIKGSTPIGDEVHITMDLKLPYIRSEGQSEIIATEQAQRFQDLFDPEKGALGFIAKDYLENSADPLKGGLLKEVGGEMQLSDEATDKAYFGMLQTRLNQIPGIETDLGDILSSATTAYEKVGAILEMDIKGNSRLTELVDGLSQDISSLNSVQRLLTEVPGNDYGLGTKTIVNSNNQSEEVESVVPLNRSAPTGRQYSAIDDELAYQYLGRIFLKGNAQAVSDITQLNLSVSGDSMETNYARFMADTFNMDEAVLFTATPSRISKQFMSRLNITTISRTDEDIYGISSNKNVIGYVSVSEPADFGNASEIIETQESGQPLVFVNGITMIRADEVNDEIKMISRNQGRDLVIMNADGSTTVVRPNGEEMAIEEMPEIKPLGLTGTEAVSRLQQIYKDGGKVLNVEYGLGRDYGTDIDTLANSRFVNLFDENSDNTDKSQNIGRDREKGGSREKVIVYLNNQGTTSIDQMYNNMAQNEVTNIRNVNIQDIQGEITNTGYRFIQELQTLDDSGQVLPGVNTKLFDSLAKSWRANANLDVSMGKEAVDPAKYIVENGVNKLQDFINRINEDASIMSQLSPDAQEFIKSSYKEDGFEASDIEFNSPVITFAGDIDITNFQDSNINYSILDSKGREVARFNGIQSESELAKAIYDKGYLNGGSFKITSGESSYDFDVIPPEMNSDNMLSAAINVKDLISRINQVYTPFDFEEKISSGRYIASQSRVIPAAENKNVPIAEQIPQVVNDVKNAAVKVATDNLKPQIGFVRTLEKAFVAITTPRINGLPVVRLTTGLDKLAAGSSLNTLSYDNAKILDKELISYRQPTGNLIVPQISKPTGQDYSQMTLNTLITNNITKNVTNSFKNIVQDPLTQNEITNNLVNSTGKRYIYADNIKDDFLVVLSGGTKSDGKPIVSAMQISANASDNKQVLTQNLNNLLSPFDKKVRKLDVYIAGGYETKSSVNTLASMINELQTKFGKEAINIKQVDVLGTKKATRSLIFDTQEMSLAKAETPVEQQQVQNAFNLRDWFSKLFAGRQSQTQEITVQKTAEVPTTTKSPFATFLSNIGKAISSRARTAWTGIKNSFNKLATRIKELRIQQIAQKPVEEVTKTETTPVKEVPSTTKENVPEVQKPVEAPAVNQEIINQVSQPKELNVAETKLNPIQAILAKFTNLFKPQPKLTEEQKAQIKENAQKNKLANTIDHLPFTSPAKFIIKRAILWPFFIKAGQAISGFLAQWVSPILTNAGKTAAVNITKIVSSVFKSVIAVPIIDGALTISRTAIQLSSINKQFAKLAKAESKVDVLYNKVYEPLNKRYGIFSVINARVRGGSTNEVVNYILTRLAPLAIVPGRLSPNAPKTALFVSGAWVFEDAIKHLISFNWLNRVIEKNNLQEAWNNKMDLMGTPEGKLQLAKEKANKIVQQSKIKSLTGVYWTAINIGFTDLVLRFADVVTKYLITRYNLPTANIPPILGLTGLEGKVIGLQLLFTLARPTWDTLKNWILQPSLVNLEARKQLMEGWMNEKGPLAFFVKKVIYPIEMKILDNGRLVGMVVNPIAAKINDFKAKVNMGESEANIRESVLKGELSPIAIPTAYLWNFLQRLQVKAFNNNTNAKSIPDYLIDSIAKRGGNKAGPATTQVTPKASSAVATFFNKAALTFDKFTQVKKGFPLSILNQSPNNVTGIFGFAATRFIGYNIPILSLPLKIYDGLRFVRWLGAKFNFLPPYTVITETVVPKMTISPEEITFGKANQILPAVIESVIDKYYLVNSPLSEGQLVEKVISDPVIQPMYTSLSVSFQEQLKTNTDLLLVLELQRILQMQISVANGVNEYVAPVITKEFSQKLVHSIVTSNESVSVRIRMEMVLQAQEYYGQLIATNITKDQTTKELTSFMANYLVNISTSSLAQSDILNDSEVKGILDKTAQDIITEYEINQKVETPPTAEEVKGIITEAKDNIAQELTKEEEKTSQTQEEIIQSTGILNVIPPIVIYNTIKNLSLPTTSSEYATVLRNSNYFLNQALFAIGSLPKEKTAEEFNRIEATKQLTIEKNQVNNQQLQGYFDAIEKVAEARRQLEPYIGKYPIVPVILKPLSLAISTKVEAEVQKANELESQINTNLINTGKSLEGIMPAFVSQGRKEETHASLLDSNENIDDNFFEGIITKNIQNETKTNGYLVGIGVANVFSGLQLFEDRTPKGVVLFDVDPEVILIGKALIYALQNSASYEEMTAFFTNKEKLTQTLIAVINQEPNVAYKQQLQEINLQDLINFINGTKFKDIDNELIKVLTGKVYQNDKINANYYIYTALKDNYDKLKGLADNGKIAVLMADMTDKSFTQAVSELPEFKTSNNVIYTSNAEDIIAANSTNINGLSDAVVLLEPNEGNANTYLETLWTNDYMLQAYDYPPFFIANEAFRRIDTKLGREVYERGAVTRRTYVQDGQIVGPFSKDYKGTYITLGRADENSLVFDDSFVSKKQATIISLKALADNYIDWVIEDLKSANGTFVNNERIQYPRKLVNGDVIQIGNTRLTVIIGINGQLNLEVSEGKAAPVAVPQPVQEVKVTPVITTWEKSIGRNTDSDIRIENDSEVSRNHAVLGKDATGIYLIDSSSTNNTYVNGKAIQGTGKVYLTGGERISFGTKTNYIFSNTSGMVELNSEGKDTFDIDADGKVSHLFPISVGVQVGEGQIIAGHTRNDPLGQDVAMSSGESMVVADGVTGGEKRNGLREGAQMAASMLLDALEKARMMATKEETEKYLTDFVNNDIQNALLSLKAEIDKQKPGSQINTTLLGTTVFGNSLIVVRVGDPELYRVRNGKVELVEKAKLSEEVGNPWVSVGNQKVINPEIQAMSNVLPNQLGMKKSFWGVKVSSFDILDGDRFFMTSDGYQKHFESEEEGMNKIKEVFNSASTPQDAENGIIATVKVQEEKYVQQGELKEGQYFDDVSAVSIFIGNKTQGKKASEFVSLGAGFSWPETVQIWRKAEANATSPIMKKIWGASASVAEFLAGGYKSTITNILNNNQYLVLKKSNADKHASEVVTELLSGKLGRRTELTDQEKVTLNLSRQAQYLIDKNVFPKLSSINLSQLQAQISDFIVKRESILKNALTYMNVADARFNMMAKNYGQGQTYNPAWLNWDELPMVTADTQTIKEKLRPNTKDEEPFVFYDSNYDLFVLDLNQFNKSINDGNLQRAFDHEISHQFNDQGKQTLIAKIQAYLGNNSLVNVYKAINEGRTEFYAYLAQLEAAKANGDNPTYTIEEFRNDMHEELVPGFDILNVRIRGDLTALGYKEEAVNTLLIGMGENGYDNLAKALGGWDIFLNYFSSFKKPAGVEIPGLTINTGWLPYQNPESWMVQLVEEDKNVSQVILFDQKTVSGNILNPSSDKVSETDKVYFYEYGNFLRSYLFDSIIIDNFKDHNLRRDWIETLRVEAIKEKGEEEGLALYGWLNTNKLSWGEIANVLMTIDFLKRINPKLMDYSLGEGEKTINEEYLDLLKMTGSGYDQLTPDGKIEVVGRTDQLVKKMLEAMDKWGKGLSITVDINPHNLTNNYYPWLREIDSEEVKNPKLVYNYPSHFLTLGQ